MSEPRLMWRCPECDASGALDFARPAHDHSTGPFGLVTRLEVFEAPAADPEGDPT